MTACLHRQGYAVNHKRVQRLMGAMGLYAIYPKPHTTIANQGHKVYPYLLRDLIVERPNQVWSADITYMRTHSLRAVRKSSIRIKGSSSQPRPLPTRLNKLGAESAWTGVAGPWITYSWSGYGEA